MTTSFTLTESQTFTITHAREMASKVATDLKRLQRFYGYPSDAEIANYETEAVALLKAGYLGAVTYGFRRNGNWIEPALRYTASELGSSSANDDPGRIRPGANIVGASFYSFLTYTSSWHALTSAEQDAFKKSLPYYRNGEPEPGVNGYLNEDRTYASGGRSLTRASVRTL